MSFLFLISLTPEQEILARIDAGEIIPNPTPQIISDYLVYQNQAQTEVYIDPAVTDLDCPEGYLAVPGNSMLGVNDFCVMKYEAKAVEISNPTVGLTSPATSYTTTYDNSATSATSANGRTIASIPSGYPIANVNQTESNQLCQDVGGSLISNNEWQTLALNIESQDSNWIGGSVGIGGLWRGHSDRNPKVGLIAGLDTDPYIETGNVSPSIEKRTLTLSTGANIWDLSGNLWEWVSDSVSYSESPISVIVHDSEMSTTEGRDFPNITDNGQFSYEEYRPSNPTWDRTQNMGIVASFNTTNTNLSGVFRGGSWGDLDGSGVFTLRLDSTPNLRFYSFGFRCVIR